MSGVRARDRNGDEAGGRSRRRTATGTCTNNNTPCHTNSYLTKLLYIPYLPTLPAYLFYLYFFKSFFIWLQVEEELRDCRAELE